MICSYGRIQHARSCTWPSMDNGVNEQEREKQRKREKKRGSEWGGEERREDTSLLESLIADGRVFRGRSRSS